MLLERIYKTDFAASHIIQGHPKCGFLHGHTYEVIVYLSGDSNEFVDFGDIKIMMDEFINNNYDHKDLGNKSVEQLGEEIIHFLKVNSFSGSLEIYETPRFGAKFDFVSHK